MFEKARKWLLEQRIAELKKAIYHWPNSPKLGDRQYELSEKEEELERINQKLLS